MFCSAPPRPAPPRPQVPPVNVGARCPVPAVAEHLLPGIPPSSPGGRTTGAAGSRAGQRTGRRGCAAPWVWCCLTLLHPLCRKPSSLGCLATSPTAVGTPPLLVDCPSHPRHTSPAVWMTRGLHEPLPVSVSRPTRVCSVWLPSLWNSTSSRAPYAQTHSHSHFIPSGHFEVELK